MTLGELKISSLMLVAPSLEINFDSDSGADIEEKIMELKANPNVIDYVNGLVFSINRAFSIIEKRGLTKTKRVKLSFDSLEKTKDGYELSVSKIAPDVLCVSDVYQAENCRFRQEGDVLIFGNLKKEALEIIYKEKLKRIKESTSDLYKIPLDDCILDVIPYFVKGELLLAEDTDEAEISRKHFFDMLSELGKTEKKHDSDFVDTVYRIW